MLYLYESTKFISLRPLASCTLVLCSSIAWKEASWVIVPSLSVSRHGWGDAFACMLAAHDLSSEKELLDLVFIRKLPAALDCWPRKCPRKIGLRSIGLMTRRKQNKSYDAAHTKAVQQSAFVAASRKIDPPNCLRWTAMETSRRWIRPASPQAAGRVRKTNILTWAWFCSTNNYFIASAKSCSSPAYIRSCQ